MNDINEKELNILINAYENNIIDSYFTNMYLSNLSSNILSVCDLNPLDECLEINSDCGQINYYLCKLVNHIDSYESGKNKLFFNRLRNKDNTNISFISDLNNINKKYDKIFLKDDLHLINKLKPLLKHNGCMYIFLNNKYGIKYLSGFKEENTSFFDPLINNNYYSKKEIINIIKNSGFKNNYFYYPLPDYDHPDTIYSEDFLPQKKSLHNISLKKDERYVFFNEDEVINQAIDSFEFETLTNSYFIKCW